MSLFSNDSHRDRSHFDQQAAPWCIAAARGKLLGPFEDAALKLGLNCPLSTVNKYVLEMGPQKRLRKLGSEVVKKIIKICPFADGWSDQGHWLINAIRWFYPSNEDFMGWYSLTTARHPTLGRAKIDRAVSVTQDPAEAWYLPSAIELGKHVGIPFDRHYFACPADSSLAQCEVAMAKIRRRLTCQPFGINNKVYYEFWFCLARPGKDDDSLKKGRIPARSASEYDHNPLRVCNTVILSLVKISHTMMYTLCAIEFDPVFGTVLSIRRSKTFPLDQAILCISPIEKVGITALLGR